MFTYFAVMGFAALVVIAHGCHKVDHDHNVGGEAKVRVIAEQEICTEESGFKTDEQKRECVMAFIKCAKGKRDADPGNKD